MAIINEGEIFARIHKFKIFRKEGNLFIDLYEALLGDPAHKFIAVPNVLFEEAVEEVIKDETGVDVDLSPSSKEKK